MQHYVALYMYFVCMTDVLFIPKVGRLLTGYTLYSCTKVKNDIDDKMFWMPNNIPGMQEACKTDTPSTKSSITDFRQIKTVKVKNSIS